MKKGVSYPNARKYAQVESEKERSEKEELKMEVFGCSKLLFTMRGNSLNFGCFRVRRFFSASFLRLPIYKLVHVAYSGFVFAWLNIPVLMGACVLL
jgi:hypothetical protein